MRPVKGRGTLQNRAQRPSGGYVERARFFARRL
jgi:hypothetical protein